ncbi:PLP-dependent transferase [Roridomyces roridus]|uniref:PLP-dependent transferase n=1 Tax=Roridomyces roridus TaxID=1738132 RepID=A0AAD7BDA1_9AGAR|nr:PLP-dependent transferase [Roridomyces roridus]
MSTKKTQSLLPNSHQLASATFLGPNAENADKLQQILQGIVKQHAETRANGGNVINSDTKASATFKDTMKLTDTHIQTITQLFNQYPVPFSSSRQTGRMNPEASLPAFTGFLMSIMSNQNNATSPMTELIEQEVGQDLCEMLGYETKKDEEGGAWGHIASDHTVANLESLWAARNLKFYPLGLHAAITRGQKPLEFIANNFKIVTLNDPTPRLFSSLEPWELLNLPQSVILNIPEQLRTEHGMEALTKTYEFTTESQYFIASSAHSSWAKAGALAGLGSNNLAQVPVDINARLDIHELQQRLQACLDARQPVYGVIATIGSEDNGAVDSLEHILALRDEFAAKGLNFVVHADAARGGYFASTNRRAGSGGAPNGKAAGAQSSSVAMRQVTVNQLDALRRADSITVDPQLAGTIPYPCSAVCYRDAGMKDILSWSQADLRGEVEFGITGSRSAAPALAAYLHHRVLPLDQNGHGALLSEVSWTARRLAAHLATMSDEKTDFVVVPFNALEDDSHKDIIRQGILGKSTDDIINGKDQRSFDVLRTVGSDLNINAFVCNFRVNGKLNDDVEEANILNRRIAERIIGARGADGKQTSELIVGGAEFGQREYGECLRNFQRRAGLETDSRQDLFVLRNIVTSPFRTDVKNLADEFQAIVQDEVKQAIIRNTVQPQVHEFIIQGSEDLYLSYRPRFHDENGRRQIILQVKMQDSKRQAEYKKARDANTGEVFRFATANKITLDGILTGGTFDGTISGPGISSQSSTKISIVNILKDRPLHSRFRDTSYPTSYTPFYLYGTADNANIEHILTRAPNAQITADGVRLDVQPALSAQQLQSGVIARILRPEAAMQPFDRNRDVQGKNQDAVFRRDETFQVEIFTDARAVDAKGPRLAEGGTRIARGTIRMRGMVFVDGERVNEGGTVHAEARAREEVGKIREAVKAALAKVKV